MRSLFSASHWFRVCIYYYSIFIEFQQQQQQEVRNFNSGKIKMNFLSLILTCNIQKRDKFPLRIQCYARNQTYPVIYIALKYLRLYQKKLLFNANIFRKYFRMHISFSFSWMSQKHTTYSFHCCTTNGDVVWERSRQHFSSTSYYVTTSRLGYAS